MRLMQSYTVIVSNEATGDLDEIANYIATVFRSASGHNFVNGTTAHITALFGFTLAGLVIQDLYRKA